MANSIFPDSVSAGGIEIRDAAGNCLAPAEVHNAYCPPATFVSTCALTALPSNCEARIEPRQINAIVSELISFAECLDPDGPWNCSSLRNLCDAFSTWVGLNRGVIYVGDVAPVPSVEDTLWYETDTGVLHLYHAGAWIQVSPPIVDGVSIVGSGTTLAPFSVSLVDCGSW